MDIAAVNRPRIQSQNHHSKQKSILIRWSHALAPVSHQNEYGFAEILFSNVTNLNKVIHLRALVLNHWANVQKVQYLIVLQRALFGGALLTQK